MEGELASFGQVMFLESFLNQAIRHSIKILLLRVRLGRLQERWYIEKNKHTANSPDAEAACGSHWAHIADFADFDRVRTEFIELYAETQHLFSIVDKLNARIVNNEPKLELRIRSRYFELMRTCFWDILPTAEAESAETTRRKHTPAEALLHASDTPSTSLYNGMHEQSEQHWLWTLIRPRRPPVVVTHLFLSVSGLIAELHRDFFEKMYPLKTGATWYRLLASLFVQMALSAHKFGEYTIDQVLQAMDLVTPDNDDRSALHPLLWSPTQTADVPEFDRQWRQVRQLIKTLDKNPSNYAAVKALYEHSSPYAFCRSLCMYLESALEYMVLPTIDIYDIIHRSGNVPQGFFETPDQTTSLPVHPQLIRSSSEAAESNSNMLLLDPFSPQASTSLPRATSLSSAELGNDDNAQSPSERVAQSQAYHQMVMSAKKPPQRAGADSSPGSPTEKVLSQRARTHDIRTPLQTKQPLLAFDEEDLDVSDVEMSPSQHAAVKRQRYGDLPDLDPTVTPPRNHNRASGLSALDDDTMDIQNTVAAESPSALLSAKHDRRFKVNLQDMPAPPLRLTSDTTCASTASTRPSAFGANVTTPESRKNTAKYVADWAHGDIEGGGRPHRRRHEINAFGTPNASRSGALPLPPPQTLLSPKNIAAAQRHNIRLDSLIAERHSGVDEYAVSSGTKRPANTPDRASSGGHNSTQVTPEHQVGSTADIRARSASRYVIRKDHGDTEGGGRKRRKHQRSSNDVAYMDI
ncbi:hypothetical protein IWW36_003922 [Coemansia brasiliensis]|uniref:Uncharacterized protein n=1 Tax=Coemansia brasiliensis TaxID=2650707 RepID=A0A9W8LZA6_9FUNG|nr:hypothetical protein IWW36_003922 [Coemansia brasiliensis]